MWSKEIIEECKRFYLLGVTLDEASAIDNGRLELQRTEYTDYRGELVLCYSNDTQFIGELKDVLTYDNYCLYVITDLRKCIEIPCPELGMELEDYFFSPSQALVPYPVQYIPDYKKLKREGKWRVRWLYVAVCVFFLIVGTIVGGAMWILALFSPFLCGLLCLLLVLSLIYPTISLFNRK